jgi:hypothetical protein
MSNAAAARLRSLAAHFAERVISSFEINEPEITSREGNTAIVTTATTHGTIYQDKSLKLIHVKTRFERTDLGSGLIVDFVQQRLTEVFYGANGVTETTRLSQHLVSDYSGHNHRVVFTSPTAFKRTTPDSTRSVQMLPTSDRPANGTSGQQRDSVLAGITRQSA